MPAWIAEKDAWLFATQFFTNSKLELRQIQLSALPLFYQNKPLGKLVSLRDGNGVHNQIYAIIMKITNIINDLLLKVLTYMIVLFCWIHTVVYKSDSTKLLQY